MDLQTYARHVETLLEAMWKGVIPCRPISRLRAEELPPTLQLSLSLVLDYQRQHPEVLLPSRPSAAG
ncbi:hypothetical protein HNR42_002025 [Deinobacterium chartae]|uniref:Uncharacterized protein n=1 Tax=Deinobacterium chartae TaxID=521158 RepID=A0A841HYH1_9DEIO|nr:hypothetical protein [Deinobacterium chartae]MBB6098591.1 hypothetical protein [Deinobacterium chartae]